MDDRQKLPEALPKRGPFWFCFSRPSKVGWWSLGLWFYHDYYVKFSVEASLLLFDFDCGWRKEPPSGR